MKVICLRLFLTIAVTFLSACAGLDKPNRNPNSISSINVDVPQNIVLPHDFATSNTSFWRFYQKGRYNGSSIRDRAMSFFTAHGALSSEHCQIEATTSKDGPQPSLKAGRYVVNIDENIFEKKRSFQFQDNRI